MPEISIDRSRCINCRLCIRLCPMGVYRDENEIGVIEKEECILCKACEAACPTDAILICQ